MRIRGWKVALLFLLIVTADVRAQFLLPVPVPAYGFGVAGPGLGWRRGVGVYPGVPYAFAVPPTVYVPASTTYVVPQSIAPSVRMHRLAEPEADLSGVDLDLVHPEDLLKPRAELEEIMAREKARRQVQGARRVAPPADFPPPPPRRVPEAEVKRPVPPAPAAPAPKIEAPPKKAEPADEYQRLLENGRQAFQQQLYGLAAQRFRQASQLKGADVQALFLLSQAQFALGQYARAVQTIHEGMRLDPQWPLAKFQPHVELYQGKDAFDVHLQRLEDVVAREPENARYLFLLGHELWFGGRRQRSLELFRRARPLADNPAFIDAFLRVGPVA